MRKRPIKLGASEEMRLQRFKVRYSCHRLCTRCRQCQPVVTQPYSIFQGQTSMLMTRWVPASDTTGSSLHKTLNVSSANAIAQQEWSRPPVIVMSYNVGWFQPHDAHSTYNMWDAEPIIQKTVQLLIWLRGWWLHWKSPKLFIRLQTGAAICTVLTGEAVATGEVNQLVRIG